MGFTFSFILSLRYHWRQKGVYSKSTSLQSKTKILWKSPPPPINGVNRIKFLWPTNSSKQLQIGNLQPSLKKICKTLLPPERKRIHIIYIVRMFWIRLGILKNSVPGPRIDAHFIIPGSGSNFQAETFVSHKLEHSNFTFLYYSFHKHDVMLPVESWDGLIPSIT